METKNPLRQLGVWPVTVVEVKQTEWKDKKSMVAVMQSEDGRFIDAKFGLPLNDISTKQVKKLLEAASATKFSELKDKKLAILVAPSKYKEKEYWNPSNFWNISYLNGESNESFSTGEDSILF